MLYFYCNLTARGDSMDQREKEKKGNKVDLLKVLMVRIEKKGK